MKMSSVAQDPPIARFLFSDRRMAWLWTIVRLYLGYTWLDAAMHKVSNPAWVESGLALKGFWERAIIVDPKPVVAFDWYRSFLQFLLEGGHYIWFAKLVAYGELLIGVSLILGAFVGMSAFFAALMNWNFLMAGTVSTNPVLLLLAIVLILAWKTAGWWGLDRILLPGLGTPWQHGVALQRVRSVG
ncbi:MAG: DoxX family protein [Chloroflexi bacterium]|nr:DoxX family protein [Chloroflexota bacterium]